MKKIFFSEENKSQLVLPLNLQLFAKDGPTGQKTEKPTAKKISDSRKEGQVAKSQEVIIAASLLVFFVFLKVWIGKLGKQLIEIFFSTYQMIPQLSEGVLETKIISDFLIRCSKNILIIMAPILAVGFLAGFLSNKVQFKWKVTLKPLQPKLSKISPIQGIKRMFSVQTLAKLVMSILKIGVIVWIVYGEIKKRIYLFSDFYDMSLTQAIENIGVIIINLGIKLSVVLLIVSMGDFIFQKKKHEMDLMMSKQDIKDELKNSEGDPQIKSQIRSKMMQASQKRMMQELPKADVIITNPTHYAVAIKYDADTDSAPVVIAKGADYLAKKIKEAAAQAKIEIVENKPLARMIYHNVEINQEIPPELYQAVAEILAYVYKLRHTA